MVGRFAMAVLVAGVVAPVATAQARPESPILSDHDIFGELTEWAAGGWRLGDSANRSNSSMPAAPGLRLERSVVQVRSQTPSASSPSAISGYMDFHFNNVEHQDARLDFHRFVLLFTHSFSDRVRFVSELELEHAFVEGLEEAGELELEQAYIDFLVTRELNFRAGMLLVPVGIINERHEPPVYHGVERPFVDSVIVPSTWFEAGAGVHGEVGRGLRYRAYVMAPLDATGFSADEGLRGGRQKGAQANVRNAATTGRIEYVGVPGLWTGASFWRGKTGFRFPRVETQVTMAEVDARYRAGELEARAQYAHSWLDGMGELSRTLQRTIGVSPNIARQIRGFYLEASYFVLPNPAPREAAVFVRYENFDTQFRMPGGFEALPQFDRDAWMVGFSYYPDPDVVLKLDYSIVGNQSDVVEAPNSLNIGLGWWF
ncbi:MAG: hypothetical protein CL477_17040 [Acidobacteria bacterium]|nr:hypothetical protein [Acidobacteriota bacterium]